LLLGPVEDLLKKGNEDLSVKRGLLQVMKRNGRRLLRLINQLLDLSRLETGKMKLLVSEGNLEEFVRTIILSFLSLAESKNTKYHFDLPQTELPVFFDSDKVEKILTNLVSNAFKFTPREGEVRVTLRYNDRGGAGSVLMAEMKVSDTGKGIPAEQQEKIFDRFYQVSDSDTRDVEGSGIGLALTKELVDLYRGEIAVESEPGKGTVFTVLIPVSKELFSKGEILEKPRDQIQEEFKSLIDMEKEEPADLEPVSVQIKGDNVSGPLVLIVEDNADLRKYISSNLEPGYEIIHAVNGREGLNRAIEGIPDLVISDVMMPEMDGMEMCGHLKRDERTSHIPVIMLTARADFDSKMEGLESGADDYLVKPFHAEELQIRAKNLIDQRKRLRDKFRKEFALYSGAEKESVFRDSVLQNVIRICEKNIDDPDFTIEDLGSELHMSRAQAFRKISAVSGSTPNDLLRTIRLKKAARLLSEGRENVTQVMYQVGYKNLSFFAKSFKQTFGINPSEFRNKRG